MCTDKMQIAMPGSLGETSGHNVCGYSLNIVHSNPYHDSNMRLPERRTFGTWPVTGAFAMIGHLHVTGWSNESNAKL